jgi:hypothetical protein
MMAGPGSAAALEREKVEGIELHLAIMLPRMQRVEIGDAIEAKDDGLAIDELLVAVLQSGFDDPGIALGPVVSAARDQSHAVAIALTRNRHILFREASPEY